MWKIKYKLKHNCIFGTNCVRADVVCVNMSFNAFRRGKSYYVYHFGTVFGDNYKKFLRLLKKDKRTEYLETDGRTFIILEKRSSRETPGMYLNPEIIYVKPFYVDSSGYETVELAAIKKEILIEYLSHFKDAEIISIKQTKLKDIYFPKLSPDFTQHQRDALEIARENGYYNFPKKIDLNKLAKKAGLSKSTFREHLKRAEAKVLSNSIE